MQTKNSAKTVTSLNIPDGHQIASLVVATFKYASKGLSTLVTEIGNGLQTILKSFATQAPGLILDRAKKTKYSGKILEAKKHLPSLTRKEHVKYVWLAATALVILNAAIFLSIILLSGITAKYAGAETSSSYIANLTTSLNQYGLRAMTAGTVTKKEFSVQGQVITLAGDNIQVFEYPNSSIAETEASRVESLAGNRKDMPTSVYLDGKAMILYLGNDQEILSALDKNIGPAIIGGQAAFE